MLPSASLGDRRTAHGRFGLYEVMPVTEEIERLTVERASSDAIRAVAIEQGMITLRDDGLRAIFDGATSIEEVVKYT